MIQIAYITLLAFCCGYALLKGGAPEQVCACIMVLGTMLSFAALPIASGRYHNMEVGVLVVDLAMAIGFVGLALYSERFWPMWISSMQLVAVMSHFTPLLVQNPLPWAYAVAIQFWSWPMLVMLAWGTARHSRRLRRFNWDPSWVRRQRSAP
jgi:hypothetical protein